MTTGVKRSPGWLDFPIQQPWRVVQTTQRGLQLQDLYWLPSSENHLNNRARTGERLVCQGSNDNLAERFQYGVSLRLVLHEITRSRTL